MAFATFFSPLRVGRVPWCAYHVRLFYTAPLSVRSATTVLCAFTPTSSFGYCSFPGVVFEEGSRGVWRGRGVCGVVAGCVAWSQSNVLVVRLIKVPTACLFASYDAFTFRTLRC